MSTSEGESFYTLIWLFGMILSAILFFVWLKEDQMLQAFICAFGFIVGLLYLPIFVVNAKG